MRKKLTAGLFFAAVFVVFVAALMYGFNKQEIVECNTWAEQAVQFKGFYLTHWQVEQCAAHHITVDAPVK